MFGHSHLTNVKYHLTSVRLPRSVKVTDSMIYQLHDHSIFTVRCRFVVSVQPTTFGVLCFATADQRQWITPGVTFSPPEVFGMHFFLLVSTLPCAFSKGTKFCNKKMNKKLAKYFLLKFVWQQGFSGAKDQ